MVLLEEEGHTTLKRRKSHIPPTAVLVPHRKHKTAPPTSTNNHHNNHRSPPLTSPASFTGADYELMISLKDSYTSLKDILPSSPSSILSPTPAIALAGISSSSSGGSGFEISIRNRLVKQAAWAYLQPALLTSPASSTSFFSGETFRRFFDDFRRLVTRVYDWLLDTLWLILCR